METGLRDLGFTYLHLDAGALIINRTADGTWNYFSDVINDSYFRSIYFIF